MSPARSIEVFLDSSIHVSMMKGEDFKSRISQVLSQHPWVGTCSYAKLEYGNVVLAKAEYYLRQLEKRGTLSRMLDWVANVTPKQQESAKTWAFNLIVQRFGHDKGDATERARLVLNQILITGLDMIDNYVDEVRDSLECYWARKGVQRTAQGQLRWQTPVCKRSRVRCKVDEFFVANRELFLEIANAIEQLSDEQITQQLAGFAAMIRRAETDPLVLREYKNCKALADALISIESTAYKSFFTQNIAESRVLCSLRQQFLYYLPPNYERGIEEYDFRPPES